MRETLMDTIRSRIEAIRGERTSGQGLGLGILETARERIESIRAGRGLAAQGGIVERLGERFPAIKRVRGQVEPRELPALFERGLTKTRREGTRRQEIAGGRVMQPPEKPAIF